MEFYMCLSNSLNSTLGSILLYVNYTSLKRTGRLHPYALARLHQDIKTSYTLILFLFCQVCSLERFRSLQDKLQLLEEAVSMHDGNVITAVSCAFCLLSA